MTGQSSIRLTLASARHLAGRALQTRLGRPPGEPVGGRLAVELESALRDLALETGAITADLPLRAARIVASWQEPRS